MKLLTVVGARPQFIKAAPLSRAIASANQRGSRRRIQEVLVHTGQHYDDNMSAVFFEELEIPSPKHHLGVGSAPHGEQTGRMLETLERVMIQERPDVMLVYGDTNSTLAGALAASKLQIPVAHVEAGLRSYNRVMPEEINRVLTDHLSSWLFCPTTCAVKNLSAEGITRGTFLVGDVMYDSLLYNLDRAGTGAELLESLKLRSHEYGLATIHRAENTDYLERLQDILGALGHIGIPIVVPLHPRTRAILQRGGGERLAGGCMVIAPVSYLEMMTLERHARLILTDSGGVQKEAFMLRIPCVTLRNETEWTETVEAGWNRLAGTDPTKIIEAAHACLVSAPRDPGNPYGDGRAAEAIVATLSGSHKVAT